MGWGISADAQERQGADGGESCAMALDLDVFFDQVSGTLRRLGRDKALEVGWSRAPGTSRCLAVDGFALRHVVLSMALTAVAAAGEGVIRLHMESRSPAPEKECLRLTVTVHPLLPGTGEHQLPLAPEASAFLAQSLGGRSGHRLTPAGELDLWLEMPAKEVEVQTSTLSHLASAAGLAVGTVPPRLVASATADADASHLDGAILDDLASFLDKSEIADYIALLRPTLARRLQDLEEGVSTGNWQGARIAAHALVGAAGCYGLVGVTRAARSVETALATGDPEAITTQATALRQRIDEAEGLVDGWRRRQEMAG